MLAAHQVTAGHQGQENGESSGDLGKSPAVPRFPLENVGWQSLPVYPDRPSMVRAQSLEEPESDGARSGSTVSPWTLSLWATNDLSIGKPLYGHPETSPTDSVCFYYLSKVPPTLSLPWLSSSAAEPQINTLALLSLAWRQVRRQFSFQDFATNPHEERDKMTLTKLLWSLSQSPTFGFLLISTFYSLHCSWRHGSLTYPIPLLP